MPVAKLSKAFLHYRDEGSPHAPVVLLSNSLGTDMSLWDVQAAALCGEFRVVRYDTRGHSGSSGCAGPCTLDDLGGDALELLDLLKIESAHVCGISLGGMTALWLALHAPERVHSVMACNTAARIGTAAGWEQRIAQVTAHGVESIAEVTMERWFSEGFRRSHAERVALTRRMFCSTDDAGYVACCEALRTADLRAELHSIRMPVLAVSGTYDPVTPPSDGRFLERNIAGASYRELPAAHLSNIEQAEAFTGAMREFFGRQK